MSSLSQLQIKFLNFILQEYQLGKSTPKELPVYDYADEFSSVAKWGRNNELYDRCESWQENEETGLKKKGHAYSYYVLRGLHWDKIFKIVNSYFDSLTAPDAEQYKINRQKAIFAEALLGKKTKIEENRFNFTEKNLLEFAPNDYHSISFSAALKEILKDKNIKVTEIKVHLVPENQLSKEPVYSIKLELFKALARGVNPYKKVLPKIEAQNSLKDVIFISEVDGIYRTRDGVNLCYPIKGNKRKNIIRNLNGKLRVEGKLLSDSYQKLSKEIAQINKLTRKNLKLPDNYNFIIRANTGGYALNDSKYEIQFVS